MYSNSPSSPIQPDFSRRTRSNPGTPSSGGSINNRSNSTNPSPSQMLVLNSNPEFEQFCKIAVSRVAEIMGFKLKPDELIKNEEFSMDGPEAPNSMRRLPTKPEDSNSIPKSSSVLNTYDKEWPDTYMTMALAAALRSPDRSTQVGCVLVAKDSTIVSIGYNGLPKGMPKDYNVYLKDTKTGPEDPDKNDWIVHAEANAIAHCPNRSALQGSTAYVTLTPCAGCAKLLIQTGIKKVVYLSYREKSGDIPTYIWAEQMFKLAGVEMEPFIPNRTVYDPVNQQFRLNHLINVFRDWVMLLITLQGKEPAALQRKNKTNGAYKQWPAYEIDYNQQNEPIPSSIAPISTSIDFNHPSTGKGNATRNLTSDFDKSSKRRRTKTNNTSACIETETRDEAEDPGALNSVAEDQDKESDINLTQPTINESEEK